MNRGQALTVVGPVFLALCAAPGTASAYSFATLNSDPGDVIGQGQNFTLTSNERPFESFSNTADVDIDVRKGTGPAYFFGFTAPAGEVLQAGRTYSDAQRAGFADPGHAGLDVNGDGRGCNTVTGSFRVLDIAATPDGAVTRLRVTYEQHCEGAAAAARGEVAYGIPDSPPALPQPDAPAGPPDRIKPALSFIKLSRSVFTAANFGPSASNKPRVGTKVSFVVSEAAAINFSVERKASGRKVGKHCAAGKRSTRKKKRCTRWVKLKGSFTVAAKAGRNQFAFSGRLAGKALRRGSYRLVGRATDGARNTSGIRREAFRVSR